MKLIIQQNVTNEMLLNERVKTLIVLHFLDNREYTRKKVLGVFFAPTSMHAWQYSGCECNCGFNPLGVVNEWHANPHFGEVLQTD